MKKQYVKPATEVYQLGKTNLLAGSGEQPGDGLLHFDNDLEIFPGTGL